MSSRLPAARRREQLLEVALHVFASRGFHQTSMNDVAEAAGVTKPVVYQHFTSKRALYLELLELVSRRLMASIDQRSEEHTSELQSLMRISYAAYCLKKKKQYTQIHVPSLQPKPYHQ